MLFSLIIYTKIQFYKYNMDRIKVNIGDKTYNCQVAKTEEDRKKGLMGVENLP